MERLRGKLTYANVVATLALFLVLAGGSAFAAGKLAKNSVGTKQIKKDAITAAKIKNGAVTGAKVAPGSIGGANINLSSLGTVPSAVRADTATSAANAGNAQTLGGKSAAQLVAASKISCPAGMKLQSGLCFEVSPRPAVSLASAIFACSEDGFWMPTLGQLLAYERQNYGAAPPSEWTEPITWDGTSDQWAYVASGDTTSSGSSFFAAKSGTAHPFRCVAAPSN